MPLKSADLPRENESVWKSRLFKFGVAAVVAGIMVSSINLSAAGALMAAMGWISWKGVV